MKFTVVLLLFTTVAGAEIKLTATGCVITKPDTAIIGFVLREKNTSLARAIEKLDQRVKGIENRARALASDSGVRMIKEVIDEDRYSTRINSENERLVTRELFLCCPNSPNLVMEMIVLLFEGAYASPPGMEPAVTYSLRESETEFLAAFDHALTGAKSRATEIAARSQQKLGKLVTVEQSIEQTGSKEVFWATGTKSPHFTSNLADNVVVTGTWVFVFSTE